MRKSSFVSTLAGSDGGEPSSPIGNPDSACLSVGQGHGPSIDGYQGHSRRTSITIAALSSPGRDSSFDAADASSSGKHGKGQKGKSDTDAAEEGRKEKERSAVSTGCSTGSAQRGLSNQQSTKKAELGGGKGSKGKRRPRAPAFFSADSGAHATHADRQCVYGQNMLPVHASKNLLLLMCLVLNDKVLVLLSIAVVVSLALGLFQDFGTQHPTFSCGNGQTCTQPLVDWVEGVAIIVAIVIVVVGSMNDWQDEKQFKKLNEKKGDHTVKIIRDGAEKVINVKDVVVGDIALLEPGEVVPCDGVFPTGHNVNCDESGMTGESNAMKKAPARRERRTVPKVLEGAGSYVVIAVSIKSFNGRIMMASGYSNLITFTTLQTDNNNTPLQMKLNNLAELIAKLWSTVGLLLFVVLLIRFFVQLSTGDPVRSVDQKGLAFVQILIISLTAALKRMTHENLLVRVLDGCETMVNASIGCTDKTGMLVQNMLSVIMGSVGIRVKFVPGIHECRRGARQRAADVLSPALRRLFNDALAGNSTALEDEDGKTSALRCMPTHYLRRYRTRRQPTGECKQEGSGGQRWHA
ncbi:E1-E2 ATPase-domain-containing protein [Phellopilus nigrolimitatus]|nr:E1-E2 ATPase-domain-containing protein [Phellopilus nigrolimitatus]